MFKPDIEQAEKDQAARAVSKKLIERKGEVDPSVKTSPKVMGKEQE